MSHNPTIHTYFDNREGEMILRESSRFFNCEYDPIHKDVRTAFLSKLRSEVKKQELIDSKLTFLCGCCKRPLKIVGGNENGKKCFHFMHIFTPAENECDFFDKIPYSKEEIKAMVFNGRTESIRHKQTKNTIASALNEEPDITMIAVEEVAKRELGKHGASLTSGLILRIKLLYLRYSYLQSFIMSFWKEMMRIGIMVGIFAGYSTM